MSLSKNDVEGKNNIPPSESDEGAEGHGTVVFAFVKTVPCSGSIEKYRKTLKFLRVNYGRNDGML
ncbi:hypothetical protein SDC9_53217 [bioreactor metagenome]|uniref:Uncharacterized protein n=1 Tax=bioreactor metagenome TaxID=1076179 RepID=A0A644WXZ6_9ZZZZ